MIKIKHKTVGKTYTIKTIKIIDNETLIKLLKNYLIVKGQRDVFGILIVYTEPNLL